MKQNLFSMPTKNLSGIIKCLLFSFLLFSFKISAQTKPPIFINEFLASNLTTNPDMVDFGDFSDWIELYNDGTTDVNLGGYYLTDDLSNPKKWQFPSNTIISAKGYYLVWADGNNDVPGKTYIRSGWPNSIKYTTKWCHTGFKLDKDKEQIGLFDSAGNAIDTISYSAQLTDVSYGRQPNGSKNWFHFGDPTPLSSNVTTGLTSVAHSGEVTFSIEGGFYPSAIQVTLTSNSGTGVIRYTTDGSKPNSSSKLYSAAISISKNTVLRAVLYENSKLPGVVKTNSYFINEPRNLPAVSLVTPPAYLWDKQLGIYANSLKEKEIPVSLEYIPLNSGRALSINAGARIGGENIFRFAQKPFNIYMRSDYGYSRFGYKIFDDQPFTEYKQLYLRNSGSDWTSTMFRDGMQVTVLKNRISNPMQNYRPSVLYLDGQYWGIHNWREKIDEQYFLMHYNVEPANLDHLEDTNVIITGDSTDFVNLTAFVSAKDLTDSTNYNYVMSKIDAHSLMDFVIVQDYVANSSWGHNRETWRDSKNTKRWQWVLVDMDRGFDASRIGTNQLDDIYNNFELFRKLTTNPKFKNEFVQRYAEHINHTFNPARVTGIIDSIKGLLQAEMPRHIQKWGTLIDSLSIDGGFGKKAGVTSMTYWNSEVQKMKDYAAQRGTYAAQYLSSRFNLSGRANLKITSSVQNQGKVDVNGYPAILGESNLYFKNIPLPMQVFAPPGFKFKQWKEIVNSSSLNIIPSGSEWKYLDGNSAPTGTWKNVDYVEAGWKTGKAQFGYGDNDETTIISYGSDAQNKYITSYYRSSFQITNPADIKELKLKLLRDDGAVVYLNGNEIVRSNMPAGTVTYTTLASSAAADESAFLEFTIDKQNLIAGKNVIAVEIHQNAATSSDASFDLSLEGILNQQSTVENVISTKPSINFTLTSDTELMAEFEKINSSEVASVINQAITLTKTNSPYIVNNDVTVETNGVLTVEPGTIIYFSSGKGMYVKGKLIVKGTVAEPITLTSFYPNERWGAICFDNSKGTSELSYVNISNATEGNDPVNFFAAISSLKSAVTLTRVNIDNVKLPISTQWSDMIIDGCTFSNATYVGDYVNCNGGNISILNSTFHGNFIPDMDAIDLGFQTGRTEIKNNTFMDFTGSNSDAVDVGDGSINVLIEGNITNNCTDKGISVGQGSKVLAVRNIISNCGLGVGVKDSLSYADIINCTFYSNTVGVAVYEKNLGRGGGKADVRNSIFAKIKDAPYTVDNLSKINISYSISNTTALPDVGNILGEPLMINPGEGNFHLQVYSPCIDKGDPKTSADLNGTRSDIGALAYSGNGYSAIVINELNYNSSTSFDSDDWLELYNRTADAIDLSGWVILDGSRKPTYAISQGSILKGKEYIVLCKDLPLFKSKYPLVNNSIGNMSSGFSGSGESIHLYDTEGRLVDSLTYDDKSPWPVEADGAGASLELQNPAFDNALGKNWKGSVGHGTPGVINSTYIVGIEEQVDKSIPTEFALQQNYPNPFNPETRISYQLSATSHVTLKVYDILGREVATLVNEIKQPGRYNCEFSPGRAGQVMHYTLPSGIYLYTLRAGSFVSTKKMILMK